MFILHELCVPVKLLFATYDLQAFLIGYRHTPVRKPTAGKPTVVFSKHSNRCLASQLDCDKLYQFTTNPNGVKYYEMNHLKSRKRLEHNKLQANTADLPEGTQKRLRGRS